MGLQVETWKNLFLHTSKKVGTLKTESSSYRTLHGEFATFAEIEFSSKTRKLSLGELTGKFF